jgi:hypothetical protein
MMESQPHACGVDDFARSPTPPKPTPAFGADNASTTSPVPNPVPRLGQFTRTLLGHSCAAPKGSPFQLNLYHQIFPRLNTAIVRVLFLSLDFGLNLRFP